LEARDIVLESSAWYWHYMALLWLGILTLLGVVLWRLQQHGSPRASVKPSPPSEQ
jgi:heme/copper-type cytochrome/quinol oxidase subunit 3